MQKKLVFDDLLINLDFINLKVKIKDNKIIGTEILFNGEENFNRKYKEIIDEIKNYFYGNKVKFDLNFISFDSLTNFQKEVLILLSEVPRGKVTTYKNISLKLKKEKVYRAVGNVMKINPFPIIIPCHRVIKSDLSLGEYRYGKDLKRKILVFEGVKFLNENEIKRECVYN
ncbi:MAG: methylated-DNA--[protein]-cysteine S-methyltransferase [Caldisericia bacterium]|nr:methylated-DNA--[protein]-cysteine S-methyltransferase [Caldisericia bacterium]